MLNFHQGWDSCSSGPPEGPSDGSSDSGPRPFPPPPPVRGIRQQVGTFGTRHSRWRHRIEGQLTYHWQAVLSGVLTSRHCRPRYERSDEGPLRRHTCLSTSNRYRNVPRTHSARGLLYSVASVHCGAKSLLESVALLLASLLLQGGTLQSDAIVSFSRVRRIVLGDNINLIQENIVFI